MFGSTQASNTGFGGGGGLFGQANNQQTSSPFGASTNSNVNTGNAFGAGGTNTGNATSGGLFGANTGTGSGGGGGLFGQSAAGQTGASTGSSLFGNTGASATPMFGNTGAGGTGNAASTGGFFGAKPTTTSSFGATPNTGTSTGLFGQQQQPQQSSNLFGQQQQQQQQRPSLFGQQQQQQPQQTTSLFGQQQQQQPQQTPSLFGQTQQQPQQTSLFGQTQQQQPQQTSLFGQTQQQQPQQTTSLFGQTQQSTQKPLFGGLNTSVPQKPTFPVTSHQPINTSFSQQQQHQLQQPAQEITLLTRPSDLPEAAQKELEALNEYITSQGRVCEELKANEESQQEMISSIPRDVELVSRKLSTAKEAFKYDDHVLSNLKKVTDKAVQDAEICFQLLGNLRGLSGGSSNPLNSSTFGASTFGTSTFGTSTYGSSVYGNNPASATAKTFRKADLLAPYFEEKINEFGNHLKELSNIIIEVENGVNAAELDSVDGYGGIKNVVDALQEEHRLFMSLGNRVAELHHDVARFDQQTSK